MSYDDIVATDAFAVVVVVVIVVVVVLLCFFSFIRIFLSEGSISIRKIKIVAEAMNVKRKRPPLYCSVARIHAYPHTHSHTHTIPHTTLTEQTVRATTDSSINE